MTKLVKASLWLSLSELAFTFSGYVIHAVLGRYMGPSEYGRYSLIVTFSTMIIMLIGSGIPTAMSKYLSEIFNTHPEYIPTIKKTGAKLQFVVISIVTILYFFLSPVFANLLNDPSLTRLFQISSLIIPSFALASFYFYYFTGIHEFGKQAFLKFTRSIAKVVFIVGLGLYFKSAGAVLGQALAPLTVFIDAYLIDPFRKGKMKEIKPDTKYEFHWKKLLNFAWPITLFMIFYELMISIDLYMVKAILQDDVQTGIYNAALTVGRIPYYIFYFLTIILLPKISQTTSQGLEKETVKTLRTSMRFLFMFLLPIVAILSLFSESAIRFFYGAKFSDAGPSMSILVVGVGFLTVFYILSFVLNGAGKNKVPMYIALGGAIINFVLNYFFIKEYGLIGSAIATSVTSFLAMIVVTVYTVQNISSLIRISSLVRFAIATILVYWVGNHLFQQGRYIFILWSALMLLGYLGVLYALKEIRPTDKALVLEIIQRKKK